MTKRKNPSEYGKRGRPPNPRPYTDPLKTHVLERADLAERKAEAIRSASDRQRSSAAERKGAMAQTLDQLSREASLKYTSKEALLAYMCDIMVNGIKETRVVSLGPLGYELVDLVDMHAGQRAAEFIYNALHADRRGPSVAVQVNGAIGAEGSQPRVVFAVVENSRLQEDTYVDVQAPAGASDDPERLPG
jgi:hypothetical protein